MTSSIVNLLPPRLLFEGSYPDISARRFAISPDGREFLLLENQEFFRHTTTLTVVTNFFDKIEKMVALTGIEPYDHHNG